MGPKRYNSIQHSNMHGKNIHLNYAGCHEGRIFVSLLSPRSSVNMVGSKTEKPTTHAGTHARSHGFTDGRTDGSVMVRAMPRTDVQRVPKGRSSNYVNIRADVVV